MIIIISTLYVIFPFKLLYRKWTHEHAYFSKWGRLSCDTCVCVWVWLLKEREKKKHDEINMLKRSSFWSTLNSKEHQRKCIVKWKLCSLWWRKLFHVAKEFCLKSKRWNVNIYRIDTVLWPVFRCFRLIDIQNSGFVSMFAFFHVRSSSFSTSNTFWFNQLIRFATCFLCC